MADLTVGVELLEVDQIDGLGSEIGVQFTVAPTGLDPAVVIAAGQKAYIQITFQLDGTTTTRISQEFTGTAITGTTIDSTHPLSFAGLYFPGELVTEATKTTVIGTPSAKVFLKPVA